MEEKTQKSLSFTEGPIFSSLIRFALPVLGSLILQAAYGAVDLLVVGWFGDAASMSAVGTGITFMQMVTLIITSLAMGTTVTIGQHIGEKKPEEAGNAIGTTILLFAVVGIALTVLLEAFAGPLADILQVPAESFDKTVLYIRICSGGILVIIAYNVISGILRGVGNANLPFLFVGIACVVNIVGDLLLVGVFHMDVAGAAIATVLAQFVSVVVSLAVLRKQALPIRFSLKQCRFYPRELRMILHVGIPIAVQETMVQISFLVINSIVNNMGLMPSAGYGVAQKIVSFIMLIPSSVMQSLSAFVAQNIGAGKQDRHALRLYTRYFHLSRRLFRRRLPLLLLHLRRGGHRPERRLSEGLFRRMHPHLHSFLQHRLLQRMRKQPARHGSGNQLRLPDPYSGLPVHGVASQYQSDPGGTFHAHHHRIRNSVFPGVLCVAQEETEAVKLLFPINYNIIFHYYFPINFNLFFYCFFHSDCI